jgi:hypothetical protein
VLAFLFKSSSFSFDFDFESLDFESCYFFLLRFLRRLDIGPSSSAGAAVTGSKLSSFIPSFDLLLVLAAFLDFDLLEITSFSALRMGLEPLSTFFFDFERLSFDCLSFDCLSFDWLAFFFEALVYFCTSSLSSSILSFLSSFSSLS